MAKFKASWAGLEQLVDKLDDVSKEETLKGIAEKALQSAFPIAQDKIEEAFSPHEKGNKNTADYIVEKANVYWNDDSANMGTGFIFDNSVDPTSADAKGGIIAQYIAFGTHLIKNPDGDLKDAIASKAKRNRAIKEIEKVMRQELIKKLK
jgi:hypothetical protein